MERKTNLSPSDNLGRIVELQQISAALKNNDLKNVGLLEFWRCLARDPEGRWKKYHRLAPWYFIGYRPRPLNTNVDKRFIRANIAASAFLIESMDELRAGMSDKTFFNWCVKIHKKNTYAPAKGGKIITEQIINVGRHTPIVADDVIQLARKYNDPYVAVGEQQLVLKGIHKKGLPVDKWSKGIVTHVYPNPQYLDDYIHMMNVTLTNMARGLNEPLPIRTKLRQLALSYQYGINPRMFVKTNHALMLTICNTFLREMRLKGIESGVLDFVAMRLRPSNFANYFIDEVRRVNKDIEFK